MKNIIIISLNILFNFLSIVVLLEIKSLWLFLFMVFTTIIIVLGIDIIYDILKSLKYNQDIKWKNQK